MEKCRAEDSVGSCLTRLHDCVTNMSENGSVS